MPNLTNTSTGAEPFNWTINSTSWTPDRPQAPYSPSLLELARSCPLRACFTASSTRYECRIVHAGRVGTAFHRTLQSLVEHPLMGRPTAVAEAARTRFMAEVRQQEAEMDANPREARLPRSQDRVRSGAEAAVAEALRILAGPPLTRRRRGHENSRSGGNEISFASLTPEGAGAKGNANIVEVEVVIELANRMIRGRVDRAEKRPEGTHLVDYKSAVRDDVPERYLRQVQLYALMWRDTRGEWPISAEIIYPFTGRTHDVSVSPEVCERVGVESLALIRKIENSDFARLASPGETCKICEFRPWCQPFWEHQKRPILQSEALTEASVGFEGILRQVKHESSYLIMTIEWYGQTAQLVTPSDRFPHLRRIPTGVHLRVLDSELHGLRHSPRVRVRDETEIFTVEGQLPSTL